MTSLFDILCDNVHAEVPGAYFDTLAFWGPHVWDPVMIPCSDIVALYSKPKTQIGTMSNGEASSSGSSTSGSWGSASSPTQMFAHTDPPRLFTTKPQSTLVGKKALLGGDCWTPSLEAVTKVAKVLREDNINHLPYPFSIS
jgi:hypothetical protein